MSLINCMQVDLFYLLFYIHASTNMSFCWDEGHLLCPYIPKKPRKTLTIRLVLVKNFIQDFDKHAKEHFTDLGKLNFPMVVRF